MCLSLSDLMGCKLPDSSVHELLQARVGSGPLCPPPGLLLTQGSNLGLLQLMLVGESFTAEPDRNPAVIIATFKVKKDR